jgi:hypothetical protein
VAAKYGDQGPQEKIPNANRGDNLTGGTPYRETVAVAGSSFGSAAVRKEA